MERLPVDQVERRAGEGRRRARTRCGSSRPRRRGSRTPRPRSTWRPSRSGSTPTRRTQTELADFYFKRFREEFRPAVDAWVATRPLKNPNAPLTPFAMPQYKLAGARGGRAARRGGGGLRRAGAPEHPARIELRARRRPVRVGAVLRRHEHQADVAEAARRDALPSAAPSSSAPPSGSRPRPSASPSEQRRTRGLEPSGADLRRNRSDRGHSVMPEAAALAVEEVHSRRRPAARLVVAIPRIDGKPSRRRPRLPRVVRARSGSCASRPSPGGSGRYPHLSPGAQLPTATRTRARAGSASVQGQRVGSARCRTWTSSSRFDESRDVGDRCAARAARYATQRVRQRRLQRSSIDVRMSPALTFYIDISVGRRGSIDIGTRSAPSSAGVRLSTRPCGERSCGLASTPRLRFPRRTVAVQRRRSGARISHTSVMATGLTVGGDVEQALESVGVPSYVLDTTGVVRWINPAAERLLGDVRGRHFTSVVAAEDSRRARELFSRKVLGTTAATDATGVLVSTAGARVGVEISAVPLMSGERVVGVFGLLEGRPDDRPHSATAASHPSSSRGASSSGAGPLDEADRRRAPPEHRDRQEPHPPSPSGPRRQLPTRSRRSRPGRIPALIDARACRAGRIVDNAPRRCQSFGDSGGAEVRVVVTVGFCGRVHDRFGGGG